MLAIFFVLGDILIHVIAWRSLDLGLEKIARLSLIPLAQTAALGWTTFAFRFSDLFRAAKRLFRIPLILALWFFEICFLVAYWLPVTDLVASGPSARVAGVLLFSSTVLILVLLVARQALPRLVSCLPFVLVALVSSSNGFFPWVLDLPGIFPESWPLLARQMTILFLAVSSLALGAGPAVQAVERHSEAAAIMLNAAILFSIVAGIFTAVNGFLYAFPVSPWSRLVVSSLSLAAACQLSSAVCLYHGEQEDQESIPGKRQDSRNYGFVSTWATLALCALACAVCLRVLFFGGGKWDVWTVAALAATGLVQTSWLRWFDCVLEHWNSAILPFIRRPFISAFFLAEFVFLSYFVYSRDLWDSKTFAVAATIWTGLKIVVLETAALFDGLQPGNRQRRAYWFFFALAVSGGIATGASALIDPGKAWLFACAGATSAVLQLRCDDSFQSDSELLFRSSEAMLFPLLSVALCSAAKSSAPLVAVHPAATALVALSIAFICVGWLENRKTAPAESQVL